MNIDGLLDTFGILYFRADDSPEESVPFEELDSIELDLYDKKKTQSQRLRAVLYKLYKQEGGEGEFKDYYKVKTEKSSLRNNLLNSRYIFTWKPKEQQVYK